MVEEPITFEEADYYLRLYFARVRYRMDLRRTRPGFPEVDPDARLVIIEAPNVGLFYGTTLLEACANLRAFHQAQEALREPIRASIQESKAKKRERANAYKAALRRRKRALLRERRANAQNPFAEP